MSSKIKEFSVSDSHIELPPFDRAPEEEEGFPTLSKDVDQAAPEAERIIKSSAVEFQKPLQLLLLVLPAIDLLEG